MIDSGELISRQKFRKMKNLWKTDVFHRLDLLSRRFIRVKYSTKFLSIQYGPNSQITPNSVKVILGEIVTTVVDKRGEPHTFKVIPKRWVVERSFTWLEKNRRL